MKGELNLRKPVLAVLTNILYAVSEVFKRAIDAIIHYCMYKYTSIFGYDEAADIKSVTQNYSEPKEQHQAIGSWLCDYANSRQPFDIIKNRQTYKKVTILLMGRMNGNLDEGKI